MINNNFKQWRSFTFLGKRFLGLLERDSHWYVYGDGLSFYGSWLDLTSFREHYRKQGDSLCLHLGSGLKLIGE